MRHLPRHSFRSMPWKNGGGVTTEIAAIPEGAGLDAFDWRISMAQVKSDGPFSLFGGVDRTLCVLRHPAFEPDQPDTSLSPAAEAVAANVERATVAALSGRASNGHGLVLDFAGRGCVRLDPVSAPFAFPADSPVTGRLETLPIHDLNIMSRRARTRHHVSRRMVSDTVDLLPAGQIMVVLAYDGPLQLSAGTGRLRLPAGDAALIAADDGLVSCTAVQAEVFIVDLWNTA